MAKYSKDPAYGDRERIPAAARRAFPAERGMNRHDTGLYEGDRRDFDPAADDDAVASRHRRRKNKAWCKGKPGVAHIPELRASAWACQPDSLYIIWPLAAPPAWRCRHQVACARCGKILQWRVSAAECPDNPRNRDGREEKIQDRGSETARGSEPGGVRAAQGRQGGSAGQGRCP